ncbi:hypothetical protein D477_019873 [Arthrobacter crystallopoietes BAB-32]|uniref:Uncharacterized protein n=1 Tax=Arthrobacter crystallopoietes BAB-32 TaxID=1246476 RepID=N1UXJ3_9MICC|nr:hypothetical protein [Arthrobacter crystallopoietes]EMY32489.1 hypothetical protein D477_019873 [Arthrobacter crystallopoietes BAB-32]
MENLSLVVPETVGGQQVGWWEVVDAFGPLATLLAAVIAGSIAWRALKQRSLADRRAEWWGRAQWALESALSDDPARRETGLGVLGILATSSLATDEEIEILGVAAVQPLAEFARPSVLPEREGAGRGSGAGSGKPEGRREPGMPEGWREPGNSEEMRERIARRAAKLQVVADQRLGRATEEWIRRLASG